MEKIKKIAKYTTNILAIVNALLIGLAPIWKIPYSYEISETLTVIIAVIGTYLLGQKAIMEITKSDDKITEKEEKDLTE